MWQPSPAQPSPAQTTAPHCTIAKGNHSYIKPGFCLHFLLHPPPSTLPLPPPISTRLDKPRPWQTCVLPQKDLCPSFSWWSLSYLAEHWCQMHCMPLFWPGIPTASSLKLKLFFFGSEGGCACARCVTHSARIGKHFWGQTGHNKQTLSYLLAATFNSQILFSYAWIKPDRIPWPTRGGVYLGGGQLVLAKAERWNMSFLPQVSKGRDYLRRQNHLHKIPDKTGRI